MTNKSAFLSSRAILEACIENVFRTASQWGLDPMPKANCKTIEAHCSSGAASSSWMRQILKSVKSRYDFAGIDRALIELVENGWHISDWQPIILRHVGRTDKMLRGFLTDWLYANYTKEIVVLAIGHTMECLHQIVLDVVGAVDVWTKLAVRRVAAGLLKVATDIQILFAKKSRDIASYRFHDTGNLLHELMGREQNTKKMVGAVDWKLFMQKPDMVEEELLRLHQYGQPRVEGAGSFLEVTLPSERSSRVYLNGRIAMDWKTRLKVMLELILSKDDPRADISSYGEMSLWDPIAATNKSLGTN